jgi:hypothetical protein
VLCDATLKEVLGPVAKARADSLSLETSSWYLQGEDTFYSWVGALVALPVWAWAIHTGSLIVLVIALAIVGLGVLWGPLRSPATSSGAYATHEVITFRNGRLSSKRVEVPLSAVVAVWVDPRPLLLPDIGDITVQYGPQEYLRVPGVRHAEDVRRELLARRDRAVARRDQQKAEQAS